MGTMTKDEQPEGRRFMRNETGGAVQVHPSARPVPDIVAAGELVEVDAWALDSLKDSGFRHVGEKTAAPEHAEQVAALTAPPADTDEAPADAGTADNQEG